MSRNQLRMMRNDRAPLGLTNPDRLTTERGSGMAGTFARGSCDLVRRELGRNVTGLSYSVGYEIFGKQLELLKEVVPARSS